MSQDYSSHRQFVPPFHFVLAFILLATLIGSCVNLFGAVRSGDGLYSASLILAISISLVIIFFYMRSFPLRAQDRAIRAEENMRNYVRTGKLLDPRLTMRQIVGLRFAPDAEFDALAERAVTENLSENDIKKAIKNWKEDAYRV